LSCQQVGELFRGQAVPAQVEHPGVGRVLLAPGAPALSFIFGMARTAVRRCGAAELTTRLLHSASRACSPVQCCVTDLRSLSASLPRVFRSAVHRPFTLLDRELKRVVPDWAYGAHDCHISSVHQNLYTRTETMHPGMRRPLKL
jgi:hypothetical protein